MTCLAANIRNSKNDNFLSGSDYILRRVTHSHSQCVTQFDDYLISPVAQFQVKVVTEAALFYFKKQVTGCISKNSRKVL